MTEPLGDKADLLLERFVLENQEFFKFDEVMLDWLNVIELGVWLDPEDEFAYGNST